MKHFDDPAMSYIYGKYKNPVFTRPRWISQAASNVPAVPPSQDFYQQGLITAMVIAVKSNSFGNVTVQILGELGNIIMRVENDIARGSNFSVANMRYLTRGNLISIGTNTVPFDCLVSFQYQWIYEAVDEPNLAL